MMILAQNLRESVLQAAIEGKLTVQLSTDSSTSILLSEITQTKKELLSNKKIAKDSSCKITPYDTDNIEAIEIPSSWKWIKLGEICTKIGAGSTPSGGSKVYVSTGIKFLREQNIHNKRLCYDGIAYITNETNAAMANSQVQAQDILLNITGASIGRNSLIPDDFDIANVNQHVLIIRLVNVELRHYVHWCLCSPFIFNQMLSGQKGDKPGLSATRVSNFLLPIPPIEEQRRIVMRIEELMQKIDGYEKTEQQLTVLKNKFPSDMREAILQSALQGKLTEQLETDSSVDELLELIFTEKENLILAGKIKKEKPLPAITNKDVPFDIPVSWRWERWGNLANSIQYGYNAPAIPQGDIRMVRISDIQDNIVDWSTVPYCQISEKEIPAYLLAENDLLFARTGGTVGKSYLVTNMTEQAVYAGYLIRSNYNKKLCPQYLKYFMESPLYWSQLRNGTTQTAQPNCNGKTLSKMMIPIPPIEEQQRIVKQLDILLPLCDNFVE